MIAVVVEKRYGSAEAAAVRSRITARSIARALEIAGPAARVVFPLGGKAFFAPDEAREEVEDLAGSPVEDPAWVAA